MSAWDLTFIAMLLSGVLVAIIAVAALYGHAYGYADSPCAPGRMANITASVQQPQRRRIVMELEPPAGWHDVMCFDAAPPPPARYVDDDPGELDDDDLDEWIDEPDLVPVPVPVPQPPPPQPMGIPVDWPTRIVQPVPLPRR